MAASLAHGSRNSRDPIAECILTAAAMLTGVMVMAERCILSRGRVVVSLLNSALVATRLRGSSRKGAVAASNIG
jgi:hypothetical protein